MEPDYAVASANADEGAPDGRGAGTQQDKVRIVAECAAIAAHLDAERSNLMIARGVKQPRQYGQHGCGEIHPISPGMPPVIDHDAQGPAGTSLKTNSTSPRSTNLEVDKSGKYGAYR